MRVQLDHLAPTAVGPRSPPRPPSRRSRAAGSPSPSPSATPAAWSPPARSPGSSSTARLPRRGRCRPPGGTPLKPDGEAAEQPAPGCLPDRARRRRHALGERDPLRRRPRGLRQAARAVRGRGHRRRGAALRHRAAQPRAVRLRGQGLHAVDDRDRHRGQRGPGHRRPRSASSWRSARRMLAHPVELLAGVAETVPALAARATASCSSPRATSSTRSRRWPASGLADHFERIEIVSEKDEATYRRVLDAAGVGPEDFLMVGNTVRSDVLPGPRHRRPRRPDPPRDHVEPRGGRARRRLPRARAADRPARLAGGARSLVGPDVGRHRPTFRVPFEERRATMRSR